VTEPVPLAAVRRGAPVRTVRRPLLRTVVSAALISALILLAGDIYAHLSSGTALWPLTSASDQLSEGERANRALAFSQIGSLTLQRVNAADAHKAVEAMGRGLTPQARQALVADLEPAGRAPQLVWLTLWDTDVEDGDVVRLDSDGYSRTVRLTKRGGTFAVPVPLDGLLTVTGITDGDGGGITVGLASGANHAVFPVMSPGQSLHLRVAAN
jgi:hypothetical protein